MVTALLKRGEKFFTKVDQILLRRYFTLRAFMIERQNVKSKLLFVYKLSALN